MAEDEFREELAVFARFAFQDDVAVVDLQESLAEAVLALGEKDDAAAGDARLVNRLLDGFGLVVCRIGCGTEIADVEPREVFAEIVTLPGVGKIRKLGHTAAEFLAFFGLAREFLSRRHVACNHEILAVNDTEFAVAQVIAGYDKRQNIDGLVVFPLHDGEECDFDKAHRYREESVLPVDLGERPFEGEADDVGGNGENPEVNPRKTARRENGRMGNRKVEGDCDGDIGDGLRQAGAVMVDACTQQQIVAVDLDSDPKEQGGQGEADECVEFHNPIGPCWTFSANGVKRGTSFGG